MSAFARVATMILLLFQDEPPPEPLTSADHIAGLVLARQGSKGIPHKNMIELNGHPLIHWVLEEMISSDVFTSIWVSTDDNDLKNYILQNKPSVKIHVRSPHTATDEASSLIAVQDFIHVHPEVSVVGLVQATSPFLKASYLKKGFELMKEYNLESVFSVTRQWKLKWKEVNENEIKSGYWTTPINFDPTSRPRRQNWSGELIENGMFYFCRKKLIEDGLLQGKRSHYVEVPQSQSLEIDTYEDLAIADILMKSKQEHNFQKEFKIYRMDHNEF